MWNAFTRWLKENHSFEKAEDFLQFYLDEAKRWARLARSLLQHLCTRLRRASK
jgi:phytoene/squalene synthetase